MGHYISNLRDIQFNLFDLLGRGEVLEKGPFAEIDRDTANGMLDEVKRMAENDLAENYPDLKASANFLSLQEELAQPMR